VTFDAGIAALVTDREFPPFLDVGLPMEVVGETVAVDAEVIGYDKRPRNKNQSYET
jgi:hypothetical protein